MRWLHVVALTLVACRVNDLVESPQNGARLQFSVQPTTVDSGEVITPAVQVSVFGAAGRVDTNFNESVGVSLAANATGAILSGTTVVAAERGVARFDDLKVDRPGEGYVLQAWLPERPAVRSSPFAVMSVSSDPPPPPPPGQATRLAFVVQPTNVDVGKDVSPAVQVAAQDAEGATVTSYNGTITLAIGSNPGGASLSGTTSVVASSGIATFGNLRLSQGGNGYTLTAGGSGLTGSTSAAFNVIGTPPPPPPPPPPTATRLAFTVQPTNTEVDKNISPNVRVAAQDASGNVVTSFTGPITIAIGNNPGGGTLNGMRTRNASEGVATFSGMKINREGGGYTLTASAGGLTGATSVSFDIEGEDDDGQLPAPAGLRFITQPSTARLNHDIDPPVQVMAVDAGGNPVTSFNGSVTIDLAPNTFGATAYGTLTVTAVNGIATFTNIRINLIGIDFRLRAMFAGQTPIVTSNAFIVLL